jgi:hypothetical protein
MTDDDVPRITITRPEGCDDHHHRRFTDNRSASPPSPPLTKAERLVQLELQAPSWAKALAGFPTLEQHMVALRTEIAMLLSQEQDREQQQSSTPALRIVRDDDR